jgi:SAM-dependent methyltransferase
MFLDMIGKNDLKATVEVAKEFIDFDEAAVYETVWDEFLSAKEKRPRGPSNRLRPLLARWIRSREFGSPDFGVYSDPYYLCDLWVCWKVYSRDTIRVIAQQKVLPPGGLISHFGDVQTVVDLGCGLGYTTGALSELFPAAKVYGTNLETSWQFSFAKKVLQGTNAEVIPSASGLSRIDLVVASEYFEHFERPVEHLHRVLETGNPRHILFANAFAAESIGHFKRYKYGGKTMDAGEISRLFYKMLHRHGFREVPANV